MEVPLVLISDTQTNPLALQGSAICVYVSLKRFVCVSVWLCINVCDLVQTYTFRDIYVYVTVSIGMCII